MEMYGLSLFDFQHVVLELNPYFHTSLKHQVLVFYPISNHIFSQITLLHVQI